MISVKVLKEAGYEEACLGLSLSHGATVERAKQVIEKLAHKQGGHNKALESIMVWLDVTAPRYWWIQAATYRISTMQSESTMHTITKRELTNADFCEAIDENLMELLNSFIRQKDLHQVKVHLPEGFLQRRVWLCSYKTLQNIVAQRNAHKLIEWRDFCDAIIDGVEHPEFLAKIDKDISEIEHGV